jgi:hypothetical protein
MPKFSSKEEYEKWKAQKAEEAKERAELIEVSKKYVRSKSRAEIEKLFKEEKPPQPFIEHLPKIFSYPFKGHGIYIIIAWVLCSWIADIFFFLWFILGGYFAAYMMKIIKSSADGEEEVPDWPDFTCFWDDILRPAFLVGGAFAFSFLPLIVYFYLTAFKYSIPFSYADPLAWLFILMGAFYWPMGLLAVAQSDSIRSLSPLIVIPSIFKVPVDYSIAVVVLIIVILFSSFAEKVLVLPIPIVGSIITKFLSFYFMILEMRILGLLYNANRNKLSWFGET